jgi:hypothetical protein
MTDSAPMSVADANLEILAAVTDTLVWLLTEHGDDDDTPPDEEEVRDLENLADMIISDLNLVVTDVREDGTILAEIRPTADESDGTDGA